MVPLTMNRFGNALAALLAAICSVSHLACGVCAIAAEGFRPELSNAAWTGGVSDSSLQQVGFASTTAMLDSQLSTPPSDVGDVLPTSIPNDGGASTDAGASKADAATVPLADYEALMERVGNLESSWQKYEDKIADEAEAKKKKPVMKIGGRVHLDNWNFLDTDAGTNELETGDPTDDVEDRWDFRRIRLEIEGAVPNNMMYRMQIDFNNPAEAEMKDVYLGFTNLPGNQVFLIGNQKRPIGLDHLNSSRHNIFAERPLAVESFNEDARRLGASMYGYTDDELFHWQYGAFLLENINTDGRARGDFDEGGLYGRISSSPWYDDVSGGRGYLHLAISGSAAVTDGDGEFDRDDNENEARFRTRPLARSDSRWYDTGRIDGAENFEQLGLETIVNVGALQITGELINTWVQRDAVNGFLGEDLNFWGAYVYASYFLTGEHIPYDRTSGTIDRVKPFENFFVVDRLKGGTGRGWGALNVALRYDYIDLSDSDISGGQGSAVTAALNWYWTAYSKLQTNMVWGEVNDGGQRLSDSPIADGIDGQYTILGMRYMIDF